MGPESSNNGDSLEEELVYLSLEDWLNWAVEKGHFTAGEKARAKNLKRKLRELTKLNPKGTYNTLLFLGKALRPEDRNCLLYHILIARGSPPVKAIPLDTKYGEIGEYLDDMYEHRFD